MGAQAEHARLGTEHLFAAVAGNAAEGGVDIHDHRVGIGNRNALACMRKHTGGQFQPFLGLIALSDVAQHHVNGRRSFILNRGALNLHIKRATVEVYKARLHHGRNGRVGNNGLHAGRLLCTEVGVNQVLRVFANQFGARLSAKNTRCRRVGIQNGTHAVHQYRVGRPFHQGAIALFAIPQLLRLCVFFDGDAGQRRRLFDQGQINGIRGPRTAVINGKSAQHLSSGRQDGLRPAGCQFSLDCKGQVRLPERVGGNLLNHYTLASEGRGAAGSIGRPNFEPDKGL